jgi:hypothetical protein
MKIPHLLGRRALRSIFAVAVAASAMLVAQGLVGAAPAQAACADPYVRVALANTEKVASPTVYIDSRQPGRQITLNRFSGFNQVAHGGVTLPGQGARFRYYRVPLVSTPILPPPVGVQPAIDHLTEAARENGVIHHQDETFPFPFTGVFYVFGEFTDCGGTVRFNVPLGYVVSPS